MPVLVSVTDWVALLEPNATWPKLRLVAERLNPGAGAGPLPPPPPPPPHAIQVPATISTVTASTKAARRRDRVRIARIAHPRNATSSQTHPPVGSGGAGGDFIWGAIGGKLELPVEVMVSVAVIVVEPVRFKVVGEKVQVNPASA